MKPHGKSLELFAVPDMPSVQSGDDLGAVITQAMHHAGLVLQAGDVVVVAQKIVSKAEGRLVELSQVSPTRRATEVAASCDKDPRLVEVILSESDEVLRCRAGLLIVRHRLGFVMANAGVDQSNLDRSDAGERVLLLPRDPDASSARLKRAFDRAFCVDVGTVISDSVGRAWRTGTVGVALGSAGIPALRDLQGHEDLFGRRLETTEVGYADLVASAAVLVMGEGAEGTPVVLVRGLSYSDSNATAAQLIRPLAQDLFR